jgi:hypothetical protein
MPFLRPRCITCRSALRALLFWKFSRVFRSMAGQAFRRHRFQEILETPEEGNPYRERVSQPREFGPANPAGPATGRPQRSKISAVD